MDDRTHTKRAVVGAGGLALTACAVALTLATAPAHHRALAAVAYALIVALPVGVGLLVLARRPRDRFAWLLVGAGAAWSTVSLAGASNAVACSLRRVAVGRGEPRRGFPRPAPPS